MKTSKAHREISLHRVPCGAVSVNASAVCKRRLRDTFDKLLDKLCSDCYAPPAEGDLPQGYELTEDGKIMDSKYLKEKAKKKPTVAEQRKAMLEKGTMRNEVAAEVAAHKEKVMPKKEEKKEPTLEDKRKAMLDEAKMREEVKVKAKEHGKRLMGNSKLLQDTSGKIEKR